MARLDDEARAQQFDRADPLAGMRERFFIPEQTIYMDGNSLGLLSRDAEAEIVRAVDAWRRLGVDGWTRADPPWFRLGEDLGAMQAPLVGASAASVVATGTTTVNLHALVATFYQPIGNRTQIVCAGLDFPSDRYALASQVALRGRDPRRQLVVIPSHDGRTIDEDACIDAFTDRVALVVLPSVLYRSGQLLDIARLTAAAHARGILIGFDCAHSIGAIPHAFEEWEVDFAFWCTYKYLNSGPGGIGALYVHPRHHARLPALRGWWGYDKDRQFDMVAEFVPAGHAGSWQISTVPLLSAAALRGSLRCFAEVGIDAIRAKSLALTTYLIDLLDELADPRYGYAVGTPREPARRGGHVAVEHAEAPRVVKALKARGVIPDFRPPNVIRLAPIALYTSFHEVWQTVQHLKAIIEQGEHLRYPPGREVVA